MKATFVLLSMTLALALHNVNGKPKLESQFSLLPVPNTNTIVTLFNTGAPSDVACLKPNCCRDVTCEPLTCLPGEEKVVPLLECCPVCRPCSQTRCEIPNCGSRELVLFPGECCPRCNPHCANVHCITPECGENERLDTPEGECCPKCVQTCRYICSGIPPICREDQRIDFLAEKCCHGCMCNYDNLYCTIPRCNFAAGEKLVVRKEESCCPVCEAGETQPSVPLQICPDVECAVNGRCPQGQRLVTPEGPCCSYCEPMEFELEREIGFGHPARGLAESMSFPRDRCIGVFCVPTFCSPGEVRFTPKGQCCEICVPFSTACDSLECERQGMECELFLELVARCVPSSEETTSPCAAAGCAVGTVCEDIGGQAVCIPTQECSFPMQCEPGTVCRVIGGDAQACVPIEQPGASCAAVQCEEGNTCKIVNGRATCVPVPPIPECRRLCEPGTVCKFIDGNAVCVPIEFA